jgi:hypothetical protein
MIPGANGRLCVPYHPVAEMARIVSRLSWSEAGVERAFSCLGLIFGDHRWSIQDDLSDALLMIKPHGIPNAAASSGLLDMVLREPAGDDASHWTGDER